MTGVLVNLNVSCIDDFVTVAIVAADHFFKKLFEQTPFGPSGKETVNAIPLSEVGRQLIPRRTGDKNPPNPAHCFEKIGGFSTFL